MKKCFNLFLFASLLLASAVATAASAVSPQEVQLSDFSQYANSENLENVVAGATSSQALTLLLIIAGAAIALSFLANGT